MTGYTQLAVKENGPNGALAELLKAMLEKGEVDAVMVPAHRDEGGVMQTLISDSAMLDAVDPFAPVVPTNSAKLVSSITANSSKKRIAVVMRSCELRALIELTKLKQANLDDLILIGIDCLGRVENTDFRKLEKESGTEVTGAFLKSVLNPKGKRSKSAYQLCMACQICESPVPEQVDINLCVLGGDGQDIWVEWASDKGDAVREKLGLDSKEGSPKDRAGAIEKLVLERTTARDKVFDEFRSKVNDFEALADHLAGCINCYNCRVACPVCYCRECVFVSDTFRHSGEQYLNWANKRGAIKLPTDTLFYHITKMVHMSAMCVGCGQCTSACPNDISLIELFRTTAEKTQTKFDYKPGRSVDEPQPLAVFNEDELGDVTGQVK